jgi:hypothetical protein
MNHFDKCLINYYVSHGIKEYRELPIKDKCELVSGMIRNLSKIEKPGLLCDADFLGILPELVTNLIETNASQEASDRLIKSLMGIFVFGFKGNLSYFQREIDECFHEQLADQRHHNDEHFEHDAMERARAAIWGLRS